MLTLLLALPAHGAELITIAADGAESNDSSFGPVALSEDGFVVAFVSRADNLVAGDTNGKADVFVRDLATQTTELVSISTTGAQGTEDSGLAFDDAYFALVADVAISGDGRFVVFSSESPNLDPAFDPADLAFAENVYRHDRQTGETVLVSVLVDPYDETVILAQGGFLVDTTFDGGFSAFVANADYAGFEQSFSDSDVFRGFVGGEPQIVSYTWDNMEGNNATKQTRPSISDSGNIVVFESNATNLLPGKNPPFGGTFFRDYAGQAVELVHPDCTDGVVSGDGAIFAWSSWVDGWVPSDANGRYDVYVSGGTATELVSVQSDGTSGTLDSRHPAIDRDGTKIAFESNGELVPGAGSATPAVYVRDRSTSETLLVSADGGAAVIGRYPAISASGDVVGFWTTAGLSSVDTNGLADLYVSEPGASEADVGLEMRGEILDGASATASWTTTVTNAGPENAENVVVSVALDPDYLIGILPVECVLEYPSVVCSLLTLFPGDEVVLQWDAEYLRGGLYGALGGVTSDTPDPGGLPEVAAAEVEIPCVADLQLEVDIAESEDGVGELDGEVTITNHGVDDAVDVTFVFEASLESAAGERSGVGVRISGGFESCFTSGGSLNPVSTLTCSFDGFASGDSETASIHLVGDKRRAIAWTAHVESACVDLVQDNQDQSGRNETGCGGCGGGGGQSGVLFPFVFAWWRRRL